MVNKKQTKLPEKLFDGTIAFLEGRFKCNAKPRIETYLKAEGASIKKKFVDSVTIVVVADKAKSKYRDQSEVRVYEPSELVELGNYDLAALLVDASSLEHVFRLPTFTYSYDERLDVETQTFSNETFTLGKKNDRSESPPWQFTKCNFKNCQFEQIKFAGPMSGRTAFKDCKFSSVKIAGCWIGDIHTSELTECKIENSGFRHFKSAKVSGTTFVGAEARSILDCKMSNGAFVDGIMPGFTECQIQDFEFNKLNLKTEPGRRPTIRSKFKNVVFKNTTIDNKTFEECQLSNVVFDNCKFSELVFENCKLDDCRFKSCKIGLVDFEASKLKKCQWSGSIPKLVGLDDKMIPNLSGVDASKISLNLSGLTKSMEFCKIFLAAGNVKFEFEGVTKSGEMAKFKIDKLRLVEFNCKAGEKEVSVVKDGFWNRSPQSLLRILVKMFSEMKLASIAAKGMKLKLTHMPNVPVIKANDFKSLAHEAFEELCS